jgi:Na+-driven multidrug efflux pump
MEKTIVFWLLLFFLGFVLINYPFLSIFDRKFFIFGIPLLYIYLLIGWLISIIVVFIFTKKIEDE